MLSQALLWTALVFAATVPWGGWAARRLQSWGAVKRIRSDEPDSHMAKWGTPTMGGAYFLTMLALGCLILWAAGEREVLLPLAPTLAFAGLGAFDDIQGLRDVEGVGWLVRGKFLAQWLVALGMGVLLFSSAEARDVRLGPSLTVALPPVVWIALAMVYMVGMANGANFADGMDGLAAGSAAAAYAALGMTCLADGKLSLGLFSLTMTGVLLAFLWHNAHPAAIFMGDTGSQALGAGLVAVALLSGRWLLLLLVGIVFVVEVISVMIQVGYFKFCKRRYGEGRRVFRMAPIHYHFELGGWSEVQVVSRFVLVAMIAGMVGVAFVLWGGVW
jgi:phospho-N-acetylmuramoyl-pentapeptide-transferase